MLNLAEPENQQKECQSKDIGFNEEQRMTARNDGQLRSEEVANGPNKPIVKPKARKWKLQPASQKHRDGRKEY
ncbi:hypothetical protein WN944_024330 [Citrus x changshan-huyou]|uniref:Uncharacterized protein n=1 Tax=Citrus x changshan-huyou TaxID=2935761 RepID=A0AAP0LMU0_9ROSI